MTMYIRYQLLLEEPVRMGMAGNQEGTAAMSYLAGSALRGALLGKYIHTYYGDRTDDLSKDPAVRRELFTDMRFTDAYLSESGRDLIPVPNVYYVDKHQKRAAEKENKKKYTVHSCVREIPNEGELRQGSGGFCRIEGKQFTVIPVHKCANLHIGTEEKTMFRYEAIDKGQVFTGYIACEEASAARMLEILDDAVLYVGGSKGSGYGRCKVIACEKSSYEKMLEFYGIQRETCTNEFTVYALSRLDLTDPGGNPAGEIDPAYLEKTLGVRNVCLKQASVASEIVSSFNHTWKAGHVLQNTVSAGSHYLYTCEGQVSKEAARKLEEKGVGLRKEEGFGRILINADFSQNVCAVYEPKKEITKRVPMTPEEKALYHDIQRRVNQRKILSQINKAAMDCMEHSPKLARTVSRTQISGLYSALQKALLCTNDREGIEIIERYMRSLMKEKNPSQFKNANAEDTYTQPVFNIRNINHTLQQLINSVTDGSFRYRQWDAGITSLPLWKDDPKAEDDALSEFRKKAVYVSDILYTLLRKERRK